MGIIGGVGTNALGGRTVNDFTVDQNDDTRVGVEVASFYLQDEMAVTNYLDIVLGARFDQFEIDVFNVPADDSRSKQDEEVSPRLGLVLKPMENMSLYASYSESFLPRSGEQFANINGSKGQLDADTFANTELGFKWDISPALSFTAAVFEIEQESPQVADNDPETLDVIKSETDGFELQLEGQLTEAVGIFQPLTAIWMESRWAAQGRRACDPESCRRICSLCGILCSSRQNWARV